jgi:putative two-component system response regulator
MAGEKILVVDDIKINREILAEILQNDYQVVQAGDGIEAFEKIINKSDGIDLFLLDFLMPEMDGYVVLETLSKSGIIDTIPVLVITAMGANENEVKALEMGAADFITKPFFPAGVLKRVELHLRLRNNNAKLEKIAGENVKKAESLLDSTLYFFASAVESRNLEAETHVKMTRALAEILFQSAAAAGNMEAEISKLDVRALSVAAALHDIGKISIPEKILLKPDKLSPEEFDTVKKHTVFGAAMTDRLEKINCGAAGAYFETCRDVCLYHHENWDGSGYPEGRREYDIPLCARIAAFADVYDSLVSKKVYRPAVLHEEAVETMKGLSGLKFDPIIMELFLAESEKIKALRKNV